jgi:hypothetical protein
MFLFIEIESVPQQNSVFFKLINSLSSICPFILIEGTLEFDDFMSAVQPENDTDVKLIFLSRFDASLLHPK